VLLPLRKKILAAFSLVRRSGYYGCPARTYILKKSSEKSYSLKRRILREAIKTLNPPPV